MYYSHISCNLRPSGTGSQTLGIPCAEEMSVLQGARALPVIWGELQVAEALHLPPPPRQLPPPRGRQPLSLLPTAPGTTRVPWCSAVSAGS